jgi:membrane protease YdiL (CAAX protease family)
MLGIVVVIAVSWAIIWVIAREHITVLGVIPNARRLKEFAAGFLLTAFVCAINLLWQSYFKEISYSANPAYGLLEALNGIWWTVKAVLFEELVYRGVILYLLIRKTGVVKACLLDALIFGIYHWFSYEMFGRGIVPMIYVLLVTGAGGWMFAYAFARTKSLFAPFGLHLGWNTVAIVVFSSGPIGSQWLIPTDAPIEMGGWATLLFFLLQVFVAPGIVTWYLCHNYSTSDTIKD